jgi:hypothetical protein
MRMKHEVLMYSLAKIFCLADDFCQAAGLKWKKRAAPYILHGDAGNGSRCRYRAQRWLRQGLMVEYVADFLSQQAAYQLLA